MHTLRPYQIDCLSRSKEAYDSGINRQLAVLATGLGKTAIAANLRAHHGFTKPIIFLVHYETLAVQAATAMQRWNPDLRVAVEMAGSYANMDGFYPPHFIVASVPTLGRKGSDRIKRFLPGDFAAVIQDEAHIGMADSFKRVYKHFGLLGPNPDGMLFLGITATPNRADGQGLRDLFDAIVFDMGIQKGIADGWLCDIRGIRVSGHADLDKVKVRAGEFAQDDLEKAVNTPKRNAIIVKEWYKHAYDRRTIAFTVDVQHALDLAEAFKAHGVAAKAVWGDDPERHEKIRGHKTGEYPIIACAQLLGIGYDDPLVNCIILSAPRKSFVRYAQEVGRGTRIADGKDCVLEGSLVLTDHGLVPIEQVSVMMKVWDGQNFVSHDGPIFKGVRKVIEHDGLIATPDHKVWTRMGWRTLEVCKLQGLAIWRGELGGNAIKVPAHIEARGEDSSQWIAGNGFGWVYEMWKDGLLGRRLLSQREGWMPPVWESPLCPEMAPQQGNLSQTAMHQSERGSVGGLRRAWDRVYVRLAGCAGYLRERPSWLRSQQADRPDRQQRTLRAWEPSPIHDEAKYQPHPQASAHASDARLPHEVPPRKIRGSDNNPPSRIRYDVRGNSGAVGHPIMQTQGRVWDLLNAGPLHRFTVSGVVVSNCLLVIDVGDNASRHNLCSISTLLGLPKDLDLKGEKYSVAKQKLDRIAAEFPTANVQDIKSLDQLKSIAENISLFQPNYPPEIARLSELAWRKSGDGYCLAVSRDLVSITQDLRGDWQIRGRVGEAVAEFSAQNLPGAMNVADRFVLDRGGVKGYLKRDTKWRGEPPTEKQISLCRILRITVPPGATKGQVSAAIDAKRIAMNQSKPEPEPYQGEY